MGMLACQKKQEDKIRLLEEKTKELEFMNAMLSDRLTLAQRKRFGPSSEKYADGYTQMSLFQYERTRGGYHPREIITGAWPADRLQESSRCEGSLAKTGSSSDSVSIGTVCFFSQ